MEFKIGDIVRLKKPHPCGSSEWEVVRVGMDFKLKCLGCGHLIMVPRKLVEKNCRGIRQNPAGRSESGEKTLANPEGT